MLLVLFITAYQTNLDTHKSYLIDKARVKSGMWSSWCYGGMYGTQLKPWRLVYVMSLSWQPTV